MTTAAKLEQLKQSERKNDESTRKYLTDRAA